MRRYAYVFLSALGLGLLGCGVPQYRIDVEHVPQGAVELQVATYVQGMIATDSPTFAVVGPLDSFTFGLNLPAVPEGQATVSVAARDASKCILAVGTRSAVEPASDGSAVDLALAIPDPAITTAMCTAAPPAILAVVRSQEGPLQTIKYSLRLQGWGFQPGATVDIHSTAAVQCDTDACMTACPVACTSNGPGKGSCRTSCVVTAAATDIVHSGPALIEVNLDPNKNVIQQAVIGGGAGTFVQPVDLLQLISQPLMITVSNADRSSTLFTEVAATKTTM